jgi:hypothetical protein
LAERGEFELPVPISEQSDDNVMSGSGAQRKRRVGWRLKRGVGLYRGNIRSRPSPRVR